ncbi:MAG: hypothetical protein JW748_03970 [Anaerolineales bacterium]|nr:hypothetical protein [Anaerolineales bacterium]
MITLFAIPKPMEGEFERLQENAIGSWIRLGFGVEVLLFGGERGVDAFARQLGLDHVAEVARTEFGTPRVDDLFAQAERRATQDLIGYINADIILGRNFLDAVRMLAAVERPFLAVGRRWDLEVAETIDYSDPGWEEMLRSQVAAKGSLHSETGIDYFIYPRGFWGRIPPFAIGRTMWDNWLILDARRRRMMVIDATESIWAVHQNHGYNHHPQGAEGVWKGPEAERNERLAGGSLRLFSILDATHRIRMGTIEKITGPIRVQRDRYMLPAISKTAAWAEAAGKWIARGAGLLRTRLARMKGKKS